MPPPKEPDDIAVEAYVADLAESVEKARRTGKIVEMKMALEQTLASVNATPEPALAG